MRIVLCITLLFGACDLGIGITREPFPPQKPEIVPYFEIPEPDSRSLDEPWVYVKTLVDADTTMPELWNAYPVGMAFSHRGRGVIATLHTAFATFDGGRTWTNLDPAPPPGFSNFNVLRSPAYLHSLAWRPTMRDSVNVDSFYFTLVNPDADSSSIRLLWYFLGSYRLHPIVQFSNTAWMTNLVLHDSLKANALAGLDGQIFHTDSINRIPRWDTLDYNFSQSFLNGSVGAAGPLVLATGSAQWISRDKGITWSTQDAADIFGDYGAHFCDSLHGLVGGGRTSPMIGWVRVTDDGANSWSPRMFNSNYPIRTVLRLTPQIGYAAGGHFQSATGGIWKTTDGGQDWIEELTASAEIRNLAANRVNSAYVDVFAAGTYPDFRGGIWKSRLFLPDTTLGFVVYAVPDSLNFGPVATGDSDTLTVVIHNSGTVAAQLLYAFNSSGTFLSPDLSSPLMLAAGDSLSLRIVCAPAADASRVEVLSIGVANDNPLPIICSVDAPDAADTRAVGGLPSELSLEIFPNPANAEFVLRFTLPLAGDALLRIFDITGRQLESHEINTLSAGEHSHSFNAQHLPSGIYFVTLASEHAQVTGKMLLLK